MIHNTIARDKPIAAGRWAQEIRRQIKSLKQHPLRYEIIPEDMPEGEEYRHVLYGNYRTIYEVEGDTVSILRVVHAARTFRPEELGD